MNALRRLFDRVRRLFSGHVDQTSPAGAEGDARAVDPTAWCLVGNIVDEHPYGEGAEVRRGSKQFRPGTKVYCLPWQWGDGYERVIAVGICRTSRRWITVVTRAALITNWRAKVVYKPAVLRRLREGFGGFNRQWESREEVEAAAEHLRRPRLQEGKA